MTDHINSEIVAFNADIKTLEEIPLRQTKSRIAKEYRRDEGKEIEHGIEEPTPTKEMFQQKPPEFTDTTFGGTPRTQSKRSMKKDEKQLSKKKNTNERQGD